MYKHAYTHTHLYAGICQRFSLGSGPQPFWHQGPICLVEDNLSTDCRGRERGAMVSG